jgi:hypothetical protein
MIDPMEVLSTESLEEALEQVRPDELETFFRRNEAALLQSEKPFAVYMRSMLKKKEILQQSLFRAADIPEKYGYRLTSEERHTMSRDLILRLCLAAGFTLKETQRALRLARQEELYARLKRDAVLIVGINEKMKVDDVNSLLKQYGVAELKRIGEKDE